MKILHLAIGRKPVYTGGSVLSGEDLMAAQLTQGHEVAVLIPGPSRWWSSVSVERVTSTDRIATYEVINPLPVALTSGVGLPRRYIKTVPQTVYVRFLNQLKPDVIHVQSIMGFHLSFFEAAKALGIPLVMTTRDYYPWCLRVSFFDRDQRLCDGPNPQKCAQCNQGAGLPILWERLIRSRLYRQLKHHPLITRIRISGRKQLHDEATRSVSKPSLKPVDVEGTAWLLEHNRRIVSLMDHLHANSPISAATYHRFVDVPTTVLPIARAVLPEPGVLRTSFDDGFRIGFVGGMASGKGLPVLLEALSYLPSSFRWVLWGDHYEALGIKNPQVEDRGRYQRDDLKSVFSSMDVLVVPSTWIESFGFVVVEALSYGLPVLCSDQVGAAFLLNDIEVLAPYPATDAKVLAQRLRALSNLETYHTVAQQIQSLRQRTTIDTHAADLEALYHQLRGQHV